MKRFIREILLENWSLKATALLLALILWMFVRSEPGTERVVAVPLEVQLPSHMEITNQRPATVEVTMRGAAFTNMWFSQPLPTCIIDLQRNAEGEHFIRLGPENVRIPKGSSLEVLQVNPSRVVIVLQQTISKAVPIIVPIRGEPDRGFEVYRKIIKPSSVVITGPRSHIEPVSAVPTDPVSIGDQKESGRFFVNLSLKDNFVRSSLIDPIQVDVQIGPQRKLITISQVPVMIDNPDYTTFPKQISIHVSAPANMIESITSSNFMAEVNVAKLNNTDLPARAKPEIHFAQNWSGLVTIERIQPSEVSVRLKQPASTVRKK